MKIRGQIVGALLLVGAAVGVVAFAGRGETPAEGGGMSGHDHAAMGSGGAEAQPVHLTPEAARRIGVTYASVEAKPLRKRIRSVGVVTYDETRLYTVNPKIEGWVEKLYVDFTGAPVKRGEPLLDIYSPALVSAQEELLLARQLLAEAGANGSSAARERAEELLESSRRRLAYWDIPSEEIARIEAQNSVQRTLTLRTPAGGIVVEKHVVEGMRVGPGMTLYRIADLSSVWVEVDVFEKDLSLVREGQEGRVTLEAYPGQVFDGRVAYVYPTVTLASRTGRVRLELPNPGLALRPGMYASVELEAPVRERALVVPRSAVLATGERWVVFVRRPDGMLEPREVQVGVEVGDEVEVLAGLDAGDVIVSSATFLIDAESNLGAAMAGMAGMEGMDMGTPGEAQGGQEMKGMEMKGTHGMTPPPGGK